MLFYLQLIISFFFGGLFIALQTLIGERVTGFWRSLVITIPSTMALGFLFIGLYKTPNDVVDVARIVPAALGPDYVFVMLFALFSRFGLFHALGLGLLGWCFSAFAILTFPPETFENSIFLYGLPMILICYFVTRRLPQTGDLKPFHITGKTIVLRSLIGGSIITLIVLLSKTWGNIWGGLFSAFPAAFSSTFIIYYLLHGKHVIPSVAKSFFFPGFFGFVIYAVVAAASFPASGIWIGTLLAYFVYAVFSAAYFWTAKFAFKRSR